MLAMMGWSEGKGLGVKEDGITKFVKVSKRETNKGLGADVNATDNWLANTSAFDGILSKLNARASSQENLAKMKEVIVPKSTVTNKRLRYHKLVKAKTLSNHKAEDISAILVPTKEESDDSDTDAYSITPLTDKKRKLEEEESAKAKITKKRHIAKPKKKKAQSDSESSDSNSDANSDSSDSSDSENSDSDASSSSSSSGSDSDSSSSSSSSDSSSSDSDNDSSGSSSDSS